jgi:pimeloyl-ACP methyl ester carboxylesterase
MIGHSIGGAVALTYAAQSGRPPLTALCVSGIGDRPTADVVGFSDQDPVGPTIEPPAEWFFGPEGSYSWKGVMALRNAAEPWRADEVDDVIRAWPARWSDIVRAVTCPVHFRLAEFERIWETGVDVLHRITTAFTQTTLDTALLPEGGHLYEIHKRGAELVDSQLTFVTVQKATS